MTYGVLYNNGNDSTEWNQNDHSVEKIEKAVGGSPHLWYSWVAYKCLFMDDI